MNKNSVDSAGQNSIQVKNIPFSEIPNQTKLFLEYQNDFQAFERFYPEIKSPLKNFAHQVNQNYRIERNKLCDVLLETNKELGGKIKTFINIEYLRQDDCVAVVTGQQAGLFSGPIYTIYKALSAVKLARDLREQNIKAVPVFWIAEEDHDFKEVSRTRILDRDGELAAAENSPEGYRSGAPVGFVKLDKKIDSTIQKMFADLQHTEFSGELEKQIRQTYQAGETYSSAFGKFLMSLLADHGVILISPLHLELKELCSPIFAEAVEKSDEIITRLSEKDALLKENGLHSQVLVEENSFPFFLQKEGGERLALRRDSDTGKIRVQNSNTLFEKSELVQIARQEPQYLSPNALLRPVVQDFLLPTLLYFGGGAEIAYFAQNSAIYEALNRPVTPIRHRASFTVIPGKHRRTLDRYNLDFQELFFGAEKIRAHIVEKYLANETAVIFAETEAVISTQLSRLERILLENEPTLAANLENRRKKIDWHIGTLRRKYHQAEIDKNEVARRRIETLYTTLLPQNALQERTLNAITFLNLYGPGFLDWIYEAIDLEEKGHQIIYL